MAFIIDPSAPAPAAGGGGDVIKDSNTANFAADVLDPSMQVPVIVDFWAPWCGPCKQLGPMLEKLVRQAGGLVRLVKINIDDNQELALQLRVQSVPTVYAFLGGRPVDAFVGAQPESKLRAFIGRLTADVQSPLDDALEHARQALAAGDARTATKIYAQILNEDPTNPKAIAGLVRAHVATGSLAKARKVVADLPPDLAANADIAAATAAIDVAEESIKAGDARKLRARVESNPDDHDARLALATALFGNGHEQDALEHLLESVRRDRAWNDEAARKQLLKLFDALGPTHPLTAGFRRRLSSLLFS